MDEDDDLLGDELGDDAGDGLNENVDYDDSQDHAPGWDKVVRYAAGDSFDSLSLDMGGQKDSDSKALSEMIASFGCTPVVTFPEEEDSETVDRSEWMMVPCQSSKAQKRNKQPAVATRFSKRIHKDGVSMLQKAEARTCSKNEMSGNPFVILSKHKKSKLSDIAKDAGVILGSSVEDIDNKIDTMLAKEEAEAVLAKNREVARKEREMRNSEDNSEHIRLAVIIQDPSSKLVVGPDTMHTGHCDPEDATPASPLAGFEKMVNSELGKADMAISTEGEPVQAKKKRGRPKKIR